MKQSKRKDNKQNKPNENKKQQADYVHGIGVAQEYPITSIKNPFVVILICLLFHSIMC